MCVPRVHNGRFLGLCRPTILGRDSVPVPASVSVSVSVSLSASVPVYVSVSLPVPVALSVSVSASVGAGGCPSVCAGASVRASVCGSACICARVGLGVRQATWKMNVGWAAYVTSWLTFLLHGSDVSRPNILGRQNPRNLPLCTRGTHMGYV